jgi:glycogen synthase kinase 3 beta
LKDCKNVVRMLDIYYSRSEDGKTAQNLVFEFCNKNLEDVIQETKKKAISLKELSKTNL